MGKKGKALKVKHYKAPPEKFLVVINPWGVYKNFDAADLNQIGAWFEVMMRDEYPNTRIRAIYYQRTHKNIIVELPREVDDIEHFLGTHTYSTFILGAALAQSEEAAYIYEYRYATFGDPTNKNFVAGHAMYDNGNIPDELPIRYPYPLPSPAPPPPMEVSYAQAVSPEVNERIANRLRDRMARVRTPSPDPGPPPVASHSQISTIPDDRKGKAREIEPESDFRPYVRPAHLTSTLLATKSEREDPGSLAESLDDEYKPSADLLDALSTLPAYLIEPNIGVKEEPSDVTLSDYQPSDDLLRALATLPDDMNLSASETDKSQKKHSVLESSPNKRNVQDFLHEADLKSSSLKRIRVKRENSE